MDLNFKILPPLVGHGKGEAADRSLFLDFSEPISKSRGPNLPHWYQPDKMQFLTFRLNDSLPASRLEELQEVRDKLSSGELTLYGEDYDEIFRNIDYWLDRGIGDCILKYEPIQKIMDEVIRFYDGVKYDLYDYVIMPNHIHALIVPYVDVAKIYLAIRRYTTKRIREVIKIETPIWQNDCFDRMVRSFNDFEEIREYIKTNPINWLPPHPQS